MEKIRLLIAEDERLTREALARLLALEEDIEVAGQAPNGRVAVALARERLPDVVLTDIQMPEMNGIEATRILKQEMPNVGIVILTIYDDDASVFDAIKAGAQGYVLKDSPPEETVAAVRAVARGEALLPPAIAARVLAEFSRISAQRAADLKVFSELTDREREVLKLIGAGKRNRQIAAELFISEKTVKNHVSNILWKLQVNDRTEAALFAARQGLV